jgi:deoxyribonuclease IV
MRLGAHISAAGGVSKAFPRAVEVEAECMQIFTRNQNRWASKPIPEEEANRFIQLRLETGIGPNMAHGSYLINLATVDPILETKSIQAFLDEIHRCDQLEIEYFVFHPGAHKGEGEERGIALVAQRLDRIIEEAGEGSQVTILLENTAGQGTTLGYEFSQLRDIIGACNYPERLGVCIDTCHTLAAGYDIRTRETYEATVEQLIAAVTLDKVLGFHFNDSKKEFGSKRDRHEQIAEGFVGLEAFEFFVNDARFEGLPCSLETPEAEERYKQELKLLRGLRTS